MENNKKFKWELIGREPKKEVEDGDIRLVNLPVKVVCQWSDKIVDDVDDEGNILSYKSGIIMKPLYYEDHVYSNQETIHLGSIVKKEN